MALRISLERVAPVKTPSYRKDQTETIGETIIQGRYSIAISRIFW